MEFPQPLQQFRPTIQFAMEVQPDSAIPFLGVLVIRKWTTLATKVYRKSTHAGQHLNFKSSHLLHVKKSFNSEFTLYSFHHMTTMTRYV
jgi:hypothetical protein